MDAAIFSVTAGVAFISSVLFGLATVRSSRRTPGKWRTLPTSLTIGSGLCVISSLCAVPAVSDAIEQASHVENTARLGAHLCGIGLCAGLRAAMTEWTHEVDSRRGAVLIRLSKAAVVGMTALGIFLAANRSGLDFTSSFAKDRGVAAYLLVVYAYGLWVGGATAVTAGSLALENARSAGHRALAAGQALLAVGGIAGVVYTGAEAAFLICHQVFGRAWRLGIEQGLSTVTAGLFMSCTFLGLAVCSLARPLLAALKR
ncbi:hypothetical protein [Kitasatospora cineracea]|uniref:hypothetical protein n=1 Tax=Kitasatospora cineracea TaxID=88074 RepID=UPI00340F8D73